MKGTLKKVEVGNTVSHLTIEHDSTLKSIEPYNQTIAIAILLGGYNEFGRKIPLEKYQEIKARFNECIEEVKTILEGSRA
jgi:hypothetical protein